MTRRRIVSICGPSSGGKSFLVQKFINYVKLSTDDFYLGKSQMKANDEGVYNFDEPSAVDLESCYAAAVRLAEGPPGAEVRVPRYDMKTSERAGDRILIVPDRQSIVVIEGIFSFHPPLLEVADFRIFIDPPPEVVLARRYRRDIEERGRTPESILKQYPNVLHGYDTYVKPMKKFADVILDFGIVV